MLTAIPDRRRRPSDGLVVEASIVARLLGIRLLKLDATVVIVPADVTAPPSALHDSRPPTRARSLGLPPSGVVSGSLADAVQRINEGAAILDEARRPVSPRRLGGDGSESRSR
ncbi:MAG: hypothetical protein WBC33_11695 [Conexibacter sp.]